MSLLKVTRPIHWYIVHCAYTKPSMDIGIDWIRKIHVDQNKWSDVGYNHFFKRDGSIEDGRPLTKYGAHTVGLSANRKSIGVCYAGGMGENGGVEDNVTVDQMLAILANFREYQKLYPEILLAGHNQFDKKACPSFDMGEYARKHGIAEESIYQGGILVKL